MKKALLLILLLLAASLLLISCDDEEDVPDGLQVIEISEEHGFKVYGPENWLIINAKTDSDSEIWGSKMSSSNNISITLARAEMPTGDINTYFEESMKQFPAAMNLFVASAPTLSNFGNAEEAYKAIYTYKYEKYDFACMQYFIKNGEDFYIFTYTSYGDVSDEESDFNLYLVEVELAIDNFLFTEKTPASSDSTENLTNPDEYLLVSDSKIAGFELYLPAGVEVINSSAYITAKINDNANIYVGKATSTGINIKQYWENRKEELSRVATDIVEIEVNKVNEDGKEVSVIFGNLPEHKVASYEFTYVIDEVKYHVYQVMGVDTFNGYVFTYTATEDEFASNLELISEILKRMKF